MAKEETKKELSEGELKEKTKKMSVRDGIGYSVMDGAGLRYITPYALAIGASNAQIGLLTSIPSLLGNLSQLFTARAIEKYSRKKVILAGVFLQAFMWLPIIAIGLIFFYGKLDHGLSATLMILFYTLFSLFGAFASPAWNSLMKDIVTKNQGGYFGKRNQITGITSLIVMFACSIILNYFTGINLFLGFIILFGIAFAARLFSAYFLTKYYEPKLKLEKGYYFSFWKFLKKIPQSNFGKFSVTISFIMFGTAIASPFFAVYMLKDLGFNYTVWTIITIAGSVSSILFMPLWGRFADRFGNLKVIKLTGILIPLIPVAWLLTPFLMKINLTVVIVYLIIEEIISNFIWAGFNLCAVNFIYDAVTRQRCALCIAYFNILNGVGIFIGATLGGLISSLNINFLGMNAILIIFLISAIARFLVYIFMMPKVKEVREVEEYKNGEMTNEFGGEIGKGIKKILLPIYNKFNIIPSGRPLGKTSVD